MSCYFYFVSNVSDILFDVFFTDDRIEMWKRWFPNERYVQSLAEI